MNIEARLIEKVGPVGGKLHTARSRNDQVALDVRLYLRDEVDAISVALKKLQSALLDQAENNLDVIMPGYTHLQTAQPVLYAHHMLAYVEMLAREAASTCCRPAPGPWPGPPSRSIANGLPSNSASPG